MMAAWFYKNKASPQGHCRVLRWFSAYPDSSCPLLPEFAIVTLYYIAIESILDNKKGAEYPF